MSQGHEVARSRVTRNVPTVGRDATAADAVRALSSGRHEVVEPVWVVDGEHLVGAVWVASALSAAPDTPIVDLLTPSPPSVSGDVDQERVALHALAHHLDGVPVVDGERFVGVVPARTLLAVLRREHVEDLHRLAGIAREEEAAVRSLEEPPTRNALHRLPWLVVGLVGAMLAGFVMGAFEETLQRRVAVAFFVPGIVYLADAVGTQTETLVVRGLARAHMSLGKVVLRELGTGLLLGVVLGALAIPVVAVGWGDPRLAVAVGAAILIACSSATTVGMGLPWALSAAGVDPAYGSGPLATIVQDVLSLLVYLGVVRLLLEGT